MFRWEIVCHNSGIMSLPPIPPQPPHQPYPTPPSYPPSGQPPYPPGHLPPVPPPGQLYVTPQIPQGMPLPPPPRDEQALAWKLFGGWGTLVVSIAMVLIGAVLGYLVVSHVAEERKYSSDAVETPAELVRKFSKERTGRRGRKSTDYYVAYRFPDKSNLWHTGEDEVDKEDYDYVNVSTQLVVQYMPDDPRTNRLLADRSQIGYWIMGLIGVGLLVGGGCMWLLGRKSAARRAAVVFRGRPVPGQVLVSEVTGSGKNQRAVLQYRWRDEVGGEQVSKRFNVKMETLSHFPAGSPITVLVDPNDPKRPEPDLWGIRA